MLKKSVSDIRHVTVAIFGSQTIMTYFHNITSDSFKGYFPDPQLYVLNITFGDHLPVWFQYVSHVQGIFLYLPPVSITFPW